MFVYTIGATTTPDTVEGDDDGHDVNNQPNGGIAGNRIPDLIDKTMAEFEDVYSFYHGSLHLQEPISGSSKITVNVVRTGGAGNEADKDFFGLGGIKAGVDPTDTRLFEYSIPHELFHTFEYGYRNSYWDLGYAERDFWYEASANWGTRQYVGHIGGPIGGANTWTGDVGAYFASISRDLSVMDEPKYGGDKYEQRQYAVNLLAQYMTEQFPSAEVVKRSWELIAAGQTAKQSIVTAVGEQAGGTLNSFYANYAQTAYQMSLTDPYLPAWIAALQDHSTANRHPVGDPLYVGPDEFGKDRPQHQTVKPALGDTLTGTPIDLGELGLGYADIAPTVAGSTIAVRVQRPDNNVRARLVPYRLINPADPHQGSLACGAAIDIVFSGTEGSTTLATTAQCNFATLMLIRVGPSGFSLFGNPVKWFVTAGVGQISNGTIQLGVNATGNLIAPGGSPSAGTQETEVGLRLLATNYDGLAPDCNCEGWGVSNGTASGG